MAAVPPAGGRDSSHLDADPFEERRPYGETSAQDIDATLGELWAEHYDLEDRRSLVAQDLRSFPNEATRRRLLDEITQIDANLAIVEAQIGMIEAEYEHRGGWNRYVVGVEDGVVHTTVECPNLESGARLRWLPALSGRPHEDADSAVGQNGCSRCFPRSTAAGVIDDWDDADLVIPAGPEEARIEAVGGGPLLGVWGEIRTVRTAWNELANSIAWVNNVEAVDPSSTSLERHRAAIGAIVAAIANRSDGLTPAEVLAEGYRAAVQRGLIRKPDDF